VESKKAAKTKDDLPNHPHRRNDGLGFAVPPKAWICQTAKRVCWACRIACAPCFDAEGTRSAAELLEMHKADIVISTYRGPVAMAQLVVRNLDADVKERLRRRAARRGRSMEEEAREILRAAVARDDEVPEPPRLGTRISRRFAGLGLSDEMPELRGQEARPADAGA
jgi:plasmid stability protein